MKSNIVLIGMPGSGKSTLGVVLAKTLGKLFLDTDISIQQHTGEILQKTINRDGINVFLKIEEEVISELQCENTVIATGGSAVLSEKAMEYLKENGTVIFLDVPLDEIKKRIDNITTRGIAMNPEDTLDSIYAVRLPLYKKYADITVNSAGTGIEKTIEEIINI